MCDSAQSANQAKALFLSIRYREMSSLRWQMSFSGGFRVLPKRQAGADFFKKGQASILDAMDADTHNVLSY
jgi:hypothetical protein